MKDAFGNPRTALVLGGNSDLGWKILSHFGQLGLDKAVLAVRDPEVVTDRLKGSSQLGFEVLVESWDACEPAMTEPLLQRATGALGDIDLVLLTVGSLGSRDAASATAAEVAALINTNFLGPARALQGLATILRNQRHGAIVVLSSVAGLRVRKRNYHYGASKAGLDAFAQGLRDNLRGYGVAVHIVRPGFITTKMTEGMDPAPFATDADSVARAVVKAVRGGRSRIIWVPPVLALLFLVFRNLPTKLWQRLSSRR